MELADTGRRLWQLLLEGYDNARYQPEGRELPGYARTLVNRLRDQLGTLIQLEIESASANASPETLQNQLNARLAALGVLSPKRDEWLASVLEVRLDRPASHPELLAVTASRIAPACGSDTSFYLFRQFEGHWARFYVYERAPYQKDEDGREGFEYVLSPKLPDGSSYLGFVYQPPWCTSCWSALNYEVRQLSTAGEVGASILAGDESFRRCADEEVEDIRPYLSMDAKGVTIRYITSSFDTGILMRRRVDRYLFKNGGLERVPSSGMTAGATLELWLDLPWKEARKWVDGAKPERLETWHTRLARVNAQDDERLSLEYEYVLPPKSPKHSWQICLSAEDANSPWKSGRGLVTLVERKGIFRIQQVKEGCPPHKGKALEIDLTGLWPPAAHPTPDGTEAEP